MNSFLSPFGERALTLVAGVFDSASAAEGMATRLQREPGLHTVVAHPGDADLDRKLEPESRGIGRTLLRSHLLLIPAGTLVGALVAQQMIYWQWAGADASPGLALLYMSVIGAFFGGMGAGAMTLRPDRSVVTRHVHAALQRGGHAVIVHPLNEVRARMAMRQLQVAGASAVRSI